MNWKIELSKLIEKSGYSHIEIYARTNIPVATISNMSNKRHKYLTCEQFILFKLLFEETYQALLDNLFGKEAFSKVKTVEKDGELTKMGSYFTDKYKYEVFPKKKLVDCTDIKSSRIDYLFTNSFENIRIDEITKLELASGEKIGSFSKLFFSHVQLNSEKEYERLLKEQRQKNNQANERRKKTEK
ncbi:hypothetical protein [Sphingobacterium corticibacterium]|uniref:Uncharacterized protein n=1 Tax=Sphingobacterium corticibacterium TaxID=2484746 RepID=A0A4Q6XGF9_9SPHI|nr:hypothetical protein [Sphingobacterium corticibacterium]RZF58573.1 hypothetical protein EWE74_18410 [Sphingobacterium corticibacterium]